MEQFTVEADFEGATTAGHEAHGADALFQFKNFRRQTDGLRVVVSDRAVFDNDLGFHREKIRRRTSEINNASFLGKGKREFAATSRRRQIGRAHV